MDCKEAISRMLESVDGELPWDVESRLREHLDECEKCRSEYERLQCATEALAEAISVLAPAKPYGTPERIEHLMAARAAGGKVVRLMTLRRFVACAAAAVIIAALPFLIRDVRQIASPEPSEPTLRAEDVVLASMDTDEPWRQLRPHVIAASDGTAGAPRPRLVRLDSGGVRVPVDHAFYDPEESSHWW